MATPIFLTMPNSTDLVALAKEVQQKGKALKQNLWDQFFARVITNIHSATTPEALDRQLQIDECQGIQRNSYRWATLTVLGQRALNQAAFVGNVSLMRHFVTLEGRVLLHLADGSGCSPLYLAVAEQHELAVKTLIELGADVNQLIMLQLRAGENSINLLKEPITSLFLAVQMKNQPITKLLVKYGGRAKPALNKEDQNILKAARLKLYSERQEVLKRIKDVLQKEWEEMEVGLEQQAKTQASKICSMIADYV